MYAQPYGPSYNSLKGSPTVTVSEKKIGECELTKLGDVLSKVIGPPI